MKVSIREIEQSYDFCVIGGGMAGMNAAISAARHGLKTVLIHDRPVLGGNASSEIRMWIVGAKGKDNRETGILEEINLENLYRNPYKNFPIWDTILFGKAYEESNLTLILNATALDAKKDENIIKTVKAWQMTTQTYFNISATYFADCSGDSILAPLVGAEYMLGRESKYMYNEDLDLEKPDTHTMGNSLLIQAEKVNYNVEFIPPKWITKKDAESMSHRQIDLSDSGENFWYLELGGDQDTILDAEEIRTEQLKLNLGVWDYIKNSGNIKGANNWQLNFLGFLPGKRESRRLVGDYVMNANDIMNEGKFHDTVAYGGWPLDDHHPGGFKHKGKANRITDVPLYGIPYRTLYSKNIDNMFFAGRNASMTHLAMSSTRVMGTCSLMGQAVGTAAYIANKYNTNPRGVLDHIEELQQTLLKEDVYLPFVQRKVSNISKNSILKGKDIKNIDKLRDGFDRDKNGVDHKYKAELGEVITYDLNSIAMVNEIRLVFDSDLNRETLPGDEVERRISMRANNKNDGLKMHLPLTLVRRFKLTYKDQEDKSHEIYVEKENIKRLHLIKLEKLAKSVSLHIEASWGHESVGIFSFEIY